MDPYPISGRIHDVPYNMMGVMVPISYQSGDWVRYGGALYRPDDRSGLFPCDYERLVLSCTDVSGKKHYAEVWNKSIFYCS